MSEDKKLIESLRGPSRVADLLGVSPQRVCNWKTRGIPPKVKVAYPHLFLKHHFGVRHE